MKTSSASFPQKRQSLCRKIQRKIHLSAFVGMLFLLGAAAPCFPSYAAPMEGDKNKPIEITADSLEVLQPDRTATFRGNVHAKQGSITLTAQQMTVYYRVKEERAGGDLGAVSKIDAVGSVVLTTPEDVAKGDSGTYNVDERKIWLVGNVTLTRGKNVLQGSRAEYSFETGKSLLASAPVEQGGKGGRVKALFVPEDKKDSH